MFGNQIGGSEFLTLRAELDAMHERLDFAERIIAQANATESIAKTAEQRHRTPPEPMALR